MAGLARPEEGTVLDSPVTTYIAPLRKSHEQQRSPEERNKRPPSRVSKHDAPKRGTASKTPPSCRSNSESRLSPGDNYQYHEVARDTTRRRLQGGKNDTRRRHRRRPDKVEQDFRP
jgi:hypothetical protein